MKPEEVLENSIENSDFVTIAGSRLYGTSVPSSDYDTRGFTFPPYEYVLNVKKFECREFSQKDHKIYSVRRFLELILKGDPMTSEMLFVKQSHIFRCSENAKRILNLRDCLISQNIYRRIMGYSYSEWRKAMGKKLFIDKRTITEDNVINDIRKFFHPEKIIMDEVIEKLMAKKDRKIVESKQGIGAKRRKEFEDYGFGVSSASHSIRLTGQLIELMETGDIIFPRPDANCLRDIREGKYSKEEVNDIYEDMRHKAENMRSKSVLPEKPDYNKVWGEYTKIISDYLINDNRFKELINKESN